MTIRQILVSPAYQAGSEVTGTLVVGADRPTPVDSLVLAARDADDQQFDFPSLDNALVTDRTEHSAVRQLPPGRYRLFGSYLLDGAWTELPSCELVVDAAPAGRQVVFDAPFSDRQAWAVGRTSAYPANGRNPADGKLDQLGPGFAPTPDGTFRARRAGALWHTDLVSTEFAPGGFELLPGDEVTATCTLNATRGSWPAIWTWGRDQAQGSPQPGHGEVDLFEYHDTNPRLLELTNHLRPTVKYADDLITPGVPFQLRVTLGEGDVRWYVDGNLVFADGAGVGPDWRAWLIVNISVAAGTYGHLPPGPQLSELDWNCADLKVWRATG